MRAKLEQLLGYVNVKNAPLHSQLVKFREEDKGFVHKVATPPMKSKR